MDWSSIVPVLVALLGIASAALTGFLAGRRRARAEYQREARLACADLMKSIAVTVHTITWFTWKAKHRAALVGAKEATKYDKTMRSLFPELVGSLALVAAFSKNAFMRSRAEVEKIYSLDTRVAAAATGLLTREPDAAVKVGEFLEDAQGLEASSKKMAHDIMASL